MDTLAIAKKQFLRQSLLQPRAAPSTGRIVAVEEGRHKARLLAEDVHEQHQQQRQCCPALLHDELSAMDSSVFVEEDVSCRVLMHRRKQNAQANIKAGIAFTKQQQKRSHVTAQYAETVQHIAERVFANKATAYESRKKLRKRSLIASGKHK